MNNKIVKNTKQVLYTISQWNVAKGQVTRTQLLYNIRNSVPYEV